MTHIRYTVGMKTTYGAFLKQVRDGRGFSQATVAAALEISRPSYVSLEKGTKELTLAEAVAVVNLFDITLDDLLRMQIPNEAKFRAMLLCFVREAAREKQVIKKTKLANLLYLADFAWYYKVKSSMSGMTYRKLSFGPAADTYFALVDALEAEGVLNITQVLREDYHMYAITETKASQKTKLTLLSLEETKLIKTIWKKWKDADTKEIIGFTMRQIPYIRAEDGAPLTYAHILKEDVANIY
jgi:DNA-binding XRE family transcriptional regulator